MIELKNVTFTYHNAERSAGVYGIDLQIPAGQVVLLCGLSGCGKTTITRFRKKSGRCFKIRALSFSVWIPRVKSLSAAKIPAFRGKKCTAASGR